MQYIDVIENVIMLLAAIIGLLSSLFHFVEKRGRRWLYLCVFFLAHFLSDYYWTIYTFVMRENPDISALIAYFGWNLGYLILLLVARQSDDLETKHFFHPLILLPVPLNLWQYFIYNQFGGFINNTWQVFTTTLISCICIRSILYYLKNREKKHFPTLNSLILFFVAAEYGMWTSSCFDWPTPVMNPYIYFVFLSSVIMMFFGWAAGRDYEAEGFRSEEKSGEEIQFQTLLKIIASFIIIGGCVGGYYIALWMKGSIPGGLSMGESQEEYSLIAITLFIISIVLVMLVLTVIFIIAHRYGSMDKTQPDKPDGRRGRFNLISTILITLALMIFSVAYTSRLFHEVSVNGVYSAGEDKAESVANELENYLVIARSALQVTADSVDLMVRNGESQDRIMQYLTFQTEDQSEQFDENFTGMYAYVRGEYMDGSGWIPPHDYDATTRDWYIDAVEAGGKTLIIPPYVDAQTKSVVITICKLISDDKDQSSYKGKNVVALDVIVNHIQEIIRQVDINGKGYGMLVNTDGLIVAHQDKNQVGENFADIFGEELLSSLVNMDNGILYADINGEPATFFVDRVMGQWYLIIPVSDSELFEEVYSQLVVNIVISLIIFVLISFFYYLGYKNEQAYDRKMEEMRINKQEQDYAAQVLRLEKKSADEANKAKSSFLADMSHEIRTPINAILGMNEMVLREATDSNIIEYSRNIGISGKNLLQLINSILDFSKIEDGKMEIVPVRYSVNELVLYLYNSISERAHAKDLKLDFNIDPGLPSELFGDDARINQIVMNLLTNAVKYTEAGSVTLTVSEKERKYGKVLIYTEVKDTGIGIKESEMDKLFESFERLDVVKNRNIEGTGLGMAITTKLLHLMDSELDVQSVYGKGSVFSFELWQEIRSEEPLGDISFSAAGAGDLYNDAETFYAPDARILVVDDTKMNIMVVVNLLKRTGIKIDTAMSGSEALVLASENEYDVILLDQRMPVMDGTETLVHLRKPEIDKNRNTPVICLTADAIKGAKDRYISQGFTDYLTKPVNGHDLEEMLLNYLPEEKIGKVPEVTPGQKEEAAPDPLYDALVEAGVDITKGLEFFDNNHKAYREILAEYVNDSVTRRENLRKYFDEKDWDNYLIYVHSLKSSSKTIGAQELSGFAQGLENAAKDKDETVILRDHDRTMAVYESIVRAIESNMDIRGNSSLKENEDGVIEFIY